MRLMLVAEIDTQTANQAIADGRLDKVTGELLNRLEPEAAYFYARGGRRAFTLVVDAPEATSLPGLTEPVWQELNANVKVFPCMSPDELRQGLAQLG